VTIRYILSPEAKRDVEQRRDDLTAEDVRFWPVLSYLIAYDPAMRPIGIARVLHASRDLEALFHRSPPRT
jgi:plasmid stabilization system protein ParE